MLLIEPAELEDGTWDALVCDGVFWPAREFLAFEKKLLRAEGDFGPLVFCGGGGSEGE